MDPPAWDRNTRASRSRLPLRSTRTLRAAERFGFTYEGVFRKHMVIKGRNRDTVWYAITDDEWPAIRRGYEAWLAEDNFDTDGRQKRSLADLMSEHR